MTKSIKFDRYRFVVNLNLIVRYGWEPEINVKCKNGKSFTIIAYADWIDVYSENNNFVKKVKDVNELFDVIPAENILSVIDDCGLDYSVDWSDRILIEDGQLYLYPENK